MEQSILDTSDVDVEYRIEKGLALILWNDTFYDENIGSLGNAPKNDKETMASIFKNCNIDVMEGENLTVPEVKEMIMEVKERIEKEKPDIFICVMSSHGGQITNKGKNKVNHVLHRVQFKDDEMDTDNITKSFNDDECPSMKGKPRLFILEVCSSRDYINPFIEGVNVFVTKTKGENDQEDGRKAIEINGASGNFSSMDGMLNQDMSMVLNDVKETDLWSIDRAEVIGTENEDESNNRDETKGTSEKDEKIYWTTVWKEKYDKIAKLFRHLQTMCGTCSVNEDAEPFGPDIYQQMPVEQGTLYYAPVEYSTVTEDEDEQEEAVSDISREEFNEDPDDLNSGGYIETTSSVCYNDCLVIFASPPGKFAICDKRGWLVDGLDKAFKKVEKRTEVDLMELLIDASFTMATEKSVQYHEDDDEMWEWDIDDDTKCIPFIEHMLTKDVILRLKS